MDKNWYESLAEKSIAGELPGRQACIDLLTDARVDLLPLLQAAFEVRRRFHGREVTVHIINNVSNGLCSEDCNYCPQAKSSSAGIVAYTEKTEKEIIAEAKQAYAA